MKNQNNVIEVESDEKVFTVAVATRLNGILGRCTNNAVSPDVFFALMDLIEFLDPVAKKYSKRYNEIIKGRIKIDIKDENGVLIGYDFNEDPEAAKISKQLSELDFLKVEGCPKLNFLSKEDIKAMTTGIKFLDIAFLRSWLAKAK